MARSPRRLLRETQSLVILVSTVMIILVAAVSLGLATAERRADLVARSVTTADETSALLAEPLYNVDDAQAVRIAEALLSSGRVSGIELVSTSDGRLVNRPPVRDASRIPPLTREILQMGIRVGSVRLFFSDAEVKKTQELFIPVTGAIVAAVILANLLASRFIIRRKFGRPIADITSGIELIARGDYDHSIPETEYQDVNAIVDLINDMADKICVADSELRERELLFRDIFNLAPYSCVVSDMEGRCVMVNEAFCRYLGFSADDLAGKRIDDLFGDHDRSAEEGRRRELLRSGAIENLEFLGRTKDGAPRYGIYSGKLITMGGRQAVLSVILDITERKTAEREVQELNRELERKVGLRTEELSLTLYRLKSAQNDLVLSEKLSALGQLAAGIAHELNTPLGAIISADGSISRYVEQGLAETMSFLTSVSETQRGLFWAVVARGSHRKSATDAAAVWERRKSLQADLESGGLGSGRRIAEILVELGLDGATHEIPGLLEDERLLPLLEHARALLMIRRMTDVVRVAAEKGAAVVAALRQYLGSEVADEIADVDVERDLETVLTLLNNKIKYGVTVERRYSGARARGSAQSLCQVWMNLINNAVQAMEYKGTLTLSTESAGDRVVVAVTDSGSGIPEGIRDRIFEPFFTTKPPGEGMGLGLDICKRIVEKQKGRILIESRPGMTRFSVELPAASGE
jgi:PAS domain S-box-containing protein